ITELHEETLIVFKPVRSPCDRIVETVRMIVFHHFADSLFKVCGGYDSKVGMAVQASLNSLTVRGLSDDVEERESSILQSAFDHDFALPTSSILGDHQSNSLFLVVI